MSGRGGTSSLVASMDNPEVLLRGRLDGVQRNRLKRLLDMQYSPRELAEEVGFNPDWVYMVYLPGGCPHTRDSKSHIWVNGAAFRLWFEEAYKRRVLAANEAFCLTCRRAVDMFRPKKRRQGGLLFYDCRCPRCGRRLARIIDYKRKKDD